jgi:tungstate transport system substrate-binding protein
MPDYAQKASVIKMATTTSTESSGLLQYLLPKFKQVSGIEVQVIAVGTGKAIKLGENGDVDLILVHARKDEDKFVKQGFGINRKDVMYNDFIIAGPAADSAAVSGLKDASLALKKIAEKKSCFISRGDESGTHKKEMELWKKAGIVPDGKWYVSAGQGMGEVLVMANEKQAYTLADRGTFIAYENKTGLAILCEGDKELNNPYGIIAVNPAKYKDVRYEDAMKFISWIVSKMGQDGITSFKINGKQVFYPSAK